MRITRHLAGSVAIVLLGLAPVGASAPAEAAKPPRTITVKAVEKRPQVFFFKGTIAPEYAKRKVTLQRQVNKGDWKPARTIRTTKLSAFKARIFRVASSRKTCWRIWVRKSEGFKSTKSAKRCIIRVG